MEDPGCNFVEWLERASVPGPGRKTNVPSRIPRVLSVGELRVVYQPVVHLRSGRVHAYEALVRSTSPHFQNPPAMFSEAIENDCCGALGRVIRELASVGCGDYPLFLNVHPNEFDEGWLVRPDDPIFGHDHPIYLEITESVPLSHFALCHSVLAEVRHKGVMLAVDDLGAGYSNLKYIADLAPEIVKLDRGLIAGMKPGGRQHLLVTGLVRLCTEVGARVVAEGIETREELEAVVEAGATYGQGYYLARPSYPPPAVQWP